MSDRRDARQSRSKGRFYKIVAVVLGVASALVILPLIANAKDLERAGYGLAGFVAMVVVMWLWGMGRRHLAPDADAAMASDRRAPVVYLRSFEDDDTLGNVEWALCDVMEDVGPFVAVGRPRDTLPPLGASRSYRKNEDWQDYVRGLLDRAALVVMLAGKTRGLQWELSQCSTRLSPERLVVLVPSDRQAYETFERNARDSGLKVRLPPYPQDRAARFKAGDICGLVHFDRSWEGSFSAFPKALFKGASHEWSSSGTRAGERIRLALRPVAEATGLPVRQPRTNFVLIGFLGYSAAVLAFIGVMAWLLATGRLK
jgi:hypothetical protein